jgi:hypothetical protein
MRDTGCNANAANDYQTQTACQGETSERILSDLFREDLGVFIEPQALRMFVRTRFGRLSPLAHRIHDGKR